MGRWPVRPYGLAMTPENPPADKSATPAAASPSPSSPSDPATPSASLKRIVSASLVGTTIEWYDFFLYGSAAALVFNTVFFPTTDPLTGTLLAFSTYAIGFAARPLGGLVFGHFGVKVGRRRLLVIRLWMLG